MESGPLGDLLPSHLSHSLAVCSWERFYFSYTPISYPWGGRGEKAVFVVLPGRGPKESASAHLKAAVQIDWGQDLLPYCTLTVRPELGSLLCF